jgi:PAS domain S-box-containing protein
VACGYDRRGCGGESLDNFIAGTWRVLAPALASAAVLLALLAWRRRQHALQWAAAGYALAFGAALGLTQVPWLHVALAWQGLVAWGLAAYLGAGLVLRGALLLPLLGAGLGGPGAAVGAQALVHLGLAALAARAWRRDRSPGGALLAAALLAGALMLVAVSMIPLPAQAGVASVAVAVGLVLAVAVELREHDKLMADGPSAQRMIAFYDALSRTNQAIARTRDRGVLFEAISRICVEAGHARMACVYVLDGVMAKRAATAGPAAEILAGIPQPWDTSQPEARGSYTVEALTLGRPLASNDYQNDPRAAPWRDQAVRHGVRAFAWLPFYRRGGVDGVLMLAAGSAGFFDEPLMKLLEKMVGDISLALDAIDQERERERAEREAQASLARFQLLFDAAPVPSSIVSIGERRLLAVNDACCAAFGLDRSQMLGRRTDELPSRLSDQDREAFYAELLRSGRVRNRVVQVQMPDATVREQVFNAESVDYLGQACLLLMSLDITDLREADRMREALARSEAASEAKTEFLARMSHELRTPLNAVLGFAQLVRRNATDRLTPTELSQLDVVQQAGWHLLTLINDVLEVSRIEAGQLLVEVRPLRLEPWLDEALQMNSELARRLGVALLADYRGAPAVGVHADPTRLRQVLLNLLSNALKYNRHGGSVRVALQADGERVRILIQDTGLGMTREQQDQLFEPFNRLGREHAGIEGSGIGLVLTRRLLQLMHGGIEVASEPDRGTLVTIWLPRADAPAAGDVPAPLAPAGTAGPRGTVVYVEDNEVNALLVEQMLARWPGVSLVVARDGRSGLDTVRSSRPDLLLLDVQLPDMDGLEVLRRLKADSETRDVPVVVLSAGAMPADVARARELGAVAYWTKPLVLDQFLEGVAQLLAPAPSPGGLPSGRAGAR